MRVKNRGWLSVLLVVGCLLQIVGGGMVQYTKAVVGVLKAPKHVEEHACAEGSRREHAEKAGAM